MVGAFRHPIFSSHENGDMDLRTDLLPCLDDECVGDEFLLFGSGLEWRASRRDTP